MRRQALSSEASEAALQQLAAGVCEAVAATDAEPSKKCQRALKSLAKARARALPWGELLLATWPLARSESLAPRFGRRTGGGGAQ